MRRTLIVVALTLGASIACSGDVSPKSTVNGNSNGSAGADLAWADGVQDLGGRRTIPIINTLSARSPTLDVGLEAPILMIRYVDSQEHRSVACEYDWSAATSNYALQQCDGSIRPPRSVVADHLELRLRLAGRDGADADKSTAATASQTRTPPADPPSDVLTQHNDSNRSGATINETFLTPARIGNAASPPREQFCFDVPDGKVMSQPLYVTDQLVTFAVEINSGFGRIILFVRTHRSLVIAASTGNTVYAFDAQGVLPSGIRANLQSCALTNNAAGCDPTCRFIVANPIWKTHLIGNNGWDQPALSGPEFADLPPDDIPVDPPQDYIPGEIRIGILATPVIDRTAGATGRVYVVTRQTTFDTAKSGECTPPYVSPTKSATDPTPLFNPATRDISNAGSCAFYMHSLDLATGVQMNRSAHFDHTENVQFPSGDSRQFTFSNMSAAQLNRPGLLLKNHTIYAAFSGTFNDAQCYEYHGWVFAYDESSLQQEGVFVTTPHWYGGGVWQSGNGLATDQLDPNVHFMVGNGGSRNNTLSPPGGPDVGLASPRACGDGTSSDPSEDINSPLLPFQVPLNASNQRLDAEDSFVALGAVPTFGSLALYTPNLPSSPFATREGWDRDLGSGGPVEIPNDDVLIGVGKDGWLHSVQASTMTPLANSPVFVGEGVPTDFTVEQNFASPVFWRENQASSCTGFGRIFIWPTNGAPLQQFNYCSSGGLSSAQAGPSGLTAGYGGGYLSLSANGDIPGSGVLWASVQGQNGTAHLYAFDADSLQQLWSWPPNTVVRVNSWAKFVPPTVAQGEVFLSTFDGFEPNGSRIHVFGYPSLFIARLRR